MLHTHWAPRALAAYRRWCQRHRIDAAEPTCIRFMTIAGSSRILLWRGPVLLACYTILPSGSLRCRCAIGGA